MRNGLEPYYSPDRPNLRLFLDSECLSLSGVRWDTIYSVSDAALYFCSTNFLKRGINIYITRDIRVTG
jgi:hypothetical protein